MNDARVPDDDEMLCRDMCAEVHAVCPFDPCPMSLPTPMRARRRVVYSAEAVQQARRLSGDHRWPLKSVGG